MLALHGDLGAAEPESVRRLLDVSGFAWHISRNTTAIEAVPKTLLAPPDPAFTLAWRSAVQKTFERDEQLRELESGIAAQMSDEDVEILLAYMETPLAVRIKQIEKSGSNPNASADLRIAAEAELARLAAEDPARLEMYSSLAEATQLVARTEVMAMTSLQVRWDALVCSGQRQVPLEQVQQDLDEARSGNRPFLERLVLLSTVNMYEPLTTPEIGSYVGLMTSEPAKRFFRSLLDVTSNLLERRTQRFRSNLAEVLGRARC